MRTRVRIRRGMPLSGTFISTSGSGTWATYQRLKSDHFSASTQPLIDYDDGEYVANVSIGTPPQNFLVLLDFNTAGFWVPDKSCPSAKCPWWCKDGGTLACVHSTLQRLECHKALWLADHRARSLLRFRAKNIDSEYLFQIPENTLCSGAIRYYEKRTHSDPPEKVARSADRRHQC